MLSVCFGNEWPNKVTDNLHTPNAIKIICRDFCLKDDAVWHTIGLVFWYTLYTHDHALFILLSWQFPFATTSRIGAMHLMHAILRTFLMFDGEHTYMCDALQICAAWEVTKIKRKEGWKWHDKNTAANSRLSIIIEACKMFLINWLPFRCDR